MQPYNADANEPKERELPKAEPFYVSIRLRRETYSRLIQAKARIMEERRANVGLTGIVDALLTEFERGTQVAASSESGPEMRVLSQTPRTMGKSQWRRIRVG